MLQIKPILEFSFKLMTPQDRFAYRSVKSEFGQELDHMGVHNFTPMQSDSGYKIKGPARFWLECDANSHHTDSTCDLHSSAMQITCNV